MIRRPTAAASASLTGVLLAAVLAGCSTSPTGATYGATNPGTTSPDGSATTATSPAGPGQATGAVALPKGVTDPAGGLVVNADTAKPGAPTLQVYEDFQCPACARVHEILGETIADLASDGSIRLVYHPMVFLDEKLHNDSSKRVTNAAACAADAGAYPRYHDAAMRAQSSDGKGYSPEQIQQFATDAGLTGAALTTWQQCEAAGTYAAYVRASEETAFAAGVDGTPTLKVNGQDLDLNGISPDVLREAVQRATN